MQKLDMAHAAATQILHSQAIHINWHIEPCPALFWAGGSNLVMIRPSCQPYLESWAHKYLGGKIRYPNMLFLAHFHYYMKDILYITLKVQAEQNVSIQNDLTL